MRTRSAATDTDEWGRRRLLRSLLAIIMAGLVLLGGLGYAVHGALPAGRPDTTGPATGSAAAVTAGAPARPAGRMPPGQARRDAIAAAPMLPVPPEAARSGAPAATVGPTITIPPAGKVGPARVPTGFARTPQGAVGQLAAIEATVLQGMSIERAHAVHAAWSAPGAVPAGRWELTASIRAFLGSAAGQYADPGAVASTPVAAQVKGTDGPDWVLACVLLDVTARLAARARIAYGHCERMQWTGSAGGRWVIAAGAAPARAPSTWPGTDLARQAGWRTWASGPDQ